ncbi:Efflux ABC transporter, ATP-binding protein [hydrothermal vent metagenome]|uniref:Efflux ABC transporter, ATP-binding protein n=1 Tax=hydrothermal vent metagenome TaxID=652676 RepID=A0A3B0QWX7_9ZZZZ
MHILKVENLSLKYGKQEVLKHISFAFKKGQIIGLLGPNGAGKSSIIKILAGLVFPDSGKLFLENVLKKNFSDLRNHCGFLIDSPAFYPYLSARQNLHLVNRINKCHVDLNELLLKVGLGNVHKKKVKNFSTGMKQRLAIAQSILRNPEILILDEPFNGLDPNGFQELLILLKKLNKNGTTIIVSSHLLNELEQFADAFILLHKGEIALNLTKSELLISKKKVAFTFDKIPNKEVKNYLDKLKATYEKPEKVILHLSPDEIAAIVNKLVALKSTPINVETLTILQEKYLEITI